MCVLLIFWSTHGRTVLFFFFPTPAICFLTPQDVFSFFNNKLCKFCKCSFSYPSVLTLTRAIIALLSSISYIEKKEKKKRKRYTDQTNIQKKNFSFKSNHIEQNIFVFQWSLAGMVEKEIVLLYDLNGRCAIRFTGTLYISLYNFV